MKRQFYIDNLRWICVALLIPYHACMAWNNWEGNYIWFHANRGLSSFIMVISPFYMPLLFTLAGVSMNYALRKRSYLQFIAERNKKLLIPFISGTLTVSAYMAYVADQFHNHYAKGFTLHYQIFFSRITDFTGYDGYFTPAHLWFILFLFIASLVMLLIVILQRKWLPGLKLEKIPLWAILAAIIIPIMLSFVLDFGGKSMGESLAFLLLGYYLFSEEAVMEKLQKYKYIFLLLAGIGCVVTTIAYVWLGMNQAMVTQIAAKIGEWFGILGLLGMGKHFLNVDNKFTRYMTVRSFPIYIFHFGWLVFFQDYISRWTSSTAVILIFSVIATIVMTLVTIELLGRIPVLRFLFGIKINKAIKM